MIYVVYSMKSVNKTSENQSTCWRIFFHSKTPLLELESHSHLLHFAGKAKLEDLRMIVIWNGDVTFPLKELNTLNENFHTPVAHRCVTWIFLVKSELIQNRLQSYVVNIETSIILWLPPNYNMVSSRACHCAWRWMLQHIPWLVICYSLNQTLSKFSSVLLQNKFSFEASDSHGRDSKSALQHRFESKQFYHCQF